MRALQSTTHIGVKRRREGYVKLGLSTILWPGPGIIDEEGDHQVLLL